MTINWKSVATCTVYFTYGLAWIAGLVLSFGLVAMTVNVLGAMFGSRTLVRYLDPGAGSFMAFVHALGSGLWLLILTVGLYIGARALRQRLSEGGVRKALKAGLMLLTVSVVFVIPTGLCVPHYLLDWYKAVPPGGRWYTFLPNIIASLMAIVILIIGILAFLMEGSGLGGGSLGSGGSSSGGTGASNASGGSMNSGRGEGEFEYRTDPKSGVQERRTKGGFLKLAGDWEAATTEKDGQSFEYRQNLATGVQERRTAGGFLKPSGDWKVATTEEGGTTLEHRQNRATGIQEQRGASGFLRPSGDWGSTTTTRDGESFESRINPATGVREQRIQGGFLKPSGDWKGETSEIDGQTCETRVNPSTGEREYRTQSGFLRPAGDWKKQRS